MNKSLAAMNGALGSCSPPLLLFAAFRGNFLCPLRGSNSFLQMWGNLSAPGVAAHPCRKQGREKWGYTEDFTVFTQLVCSSAGLCMPIILRSTLARSVDAYYANFYVHNPPVDANMQCTQSTFFFFGCCFTVIKKLPRRFKTTLCRNNTVIQMCTSHRMTTPDSSRIWEDICLLSTRIMQRVWNERAVWWTRLPQAERFLGAFICIYTHRVAKSIVKKFKSVHHIPPRLLESKTST